MTLQVDAKKEATTRGDAQAATGAAPPASPPTPDPRNLWQRLRDVKIALGGTIEKGGTAPAIMGGFGFVEWDDVAEKIGTLLALHGVMPFPSMTEHSNDHIADTSTGKPIYRASVTLTLELVNVDKPEDRAILSWPGTGDDGSDKAVQKAGTSAEKYALLKLFMLKGEKGAQSVDPDATTVGDVVRRTFAPATPQTASQPATAPSGGRVPCAACAKIGLKNKKGYAPVFWPGNVDCDGVVGEQLADGKWNYINHRMAAEDIPDVDPEDRPLSGVGAAVSAEADRVPLELYDDGGEVPV